MLFAGMLLPAGEDELRGLYRFDSYRLTYRYGLVRARRFSLDLGLTAKIRDAEIRLRYAVVRLDGARRTNTGFGLLVSFRADWQLGPRVGLVLDGDALGVSQGRAEDVMAALRAGFGNRVDARVGYRVLEGGSDEDEVYGFALLHYAVAGIATLYPNLKRRAEAGLPADLSVGLEAEPVLTDPEPPSGERQLAWNLDLDKELGWHNFTLVAGNNWHQSVPGRLTAAKSLERLLVGLGGCTGMDLVPQFRKTPGRSRPRSEHPGRALGGVRAGLHEYRHRVSRDRPRS